MNSSGIKLHKKCLLLATDMEGNSFLKKLQLQISSDQFMYALHEKFSIVITGIGKVNAACATMWAIEHGAKQIINAGIAGSVNEDLKVFNIYKPGLIKDLDLLKFSMPELKTGDSSISLGSVGSPLKGGDLRDEFASLVDLIDMEGYAIAKVSHQYGVTVEFIKIVSDYCMQNSSDEIVKNLPELSNILAEELILFLNL